MDGKDGLSAYELAKKNGFVGTLAEWLESLKGADGLPGKNGIDGKNGTDGKDGKDGRDGVDGITPDMSEYSPTSAVELMIQKITNPLSLKSHEHENQSILDNITASYTLEEQRKLAEIEPSDYATKKALADEALAIREAMIPLTRELHSHQNMAVLDMLTAEQLALLSGLQQFEDSTKYDIQTIRESVEPVISQAHWHHNLTLLNSITAAKIAKWDSISQLESDFQQFQDSTQYDQQNQNDAIQILENRITILESQLANGNNAVTLFSAGADALASYGADLFTIYNNAYNSISDFSANYPHFLSADNSYQMSFSVDDFGWNGVVYIVCTKELNLSEKSQISMCYQSGATENGDLYLVPKPERNDVPISVYVYTQIQNGTAIKIPFQWLYSDSCITTLSDCNVSNGTYYFSFAGRSNNSHPMIKRIQVLD